MFALLGIDQLDRGAYKIPIGRYQIKAVHLSLKEGPIWGLVEDQRMVKRAAGWVLGKSKAPCRVALRVAINRKSALLSSGERSCQVHDRSCLADTAFLVGDGDHSAQSGDSPHVNGGELTSMDRRMQDVSRGA